jgi:hypothetical protein
MNGTKTGIQSLSAYRDGNNTADIASGKAIDHCPRKNNLSS